MGSAEHRAEGGMLLSEQLVLAMLTQALSGTCFLSLGKGSWCSTVPCRQLVFLGRQGRWCAELESCVLPGGPWLGGSPCPELYSLLCLSAGFEILVLRAAVLSEAQTVKCCLGREELGKAGPWELARLGDWEPGQAVG